MSKADSDMVAELESVGLSLDILAASARRVCSLIATGKEPEPEEVEAGWLGVATVGAAVVGDGDTDSSLPVRQFADLLRAAYFRAMVGDFDLPPIESLPDRIRLAWEYTARHVANVLHMDQEEARKLTHHEDRMSQLGLAKLAA